MSKDDRLSSLAATMESLERLQRLETEALGAMSRCLFQILSHVSTQPAGAQYPAPDQEAGFPASPAAPVGAPSAFPEPPAAEPVAFGLKRKRGAGPVVEKQPKTGSRKKGAAPPSAFSARKDETQDELVCRILQSATTASVSATAEALVKSKPTAVQLAEGIRAFGKSKTPDDASSAVFAGVIRLVFERMGDKAAVVQVLRKLSADDLARYLRAGGAGAAAAAAAAYNQAHWLTLSTGAAGTWLAGELLLFDCFCRLAQLLRGADRGAPVDGSSVCFAVAAGVIDAQLRFDPDERRVLPSSRLWAWAALQVMAEADGKLAANAAENSVWTSSINAFLGRSEDGTSGATPDVSDRALAKLSAAVLKPFLTAEVLDCFLGLALCSCRQGPAHALESAACAKLPDAGRAPAGHWLRQLGLFLQTLAAAGPQLPEADKAELRRATAACPQPSDTLSRTLSTCCSALAGG
ncbi:hypothetical protein DIPPA_34990 [Diplonema papillatum]|nr:hypothetical protein DIPPA_34990 [Diplonema papillatum]